MNLKYLIVIVIVCLIFTFPFFQKGYFETHDGEWAIVRLSEMKRELRDLQIPPRWADYLNHGYGYPLFLFTYPLPYYIGSIFSFIGLGLTSSIKAVFILSVFSSGFGMYFYSKKHWGEFGALVASIFYITIPYRLTDLYIRGSIGESISLAIIPWVFWEIDRVFDRGKSIILPILFALLILSHNVSAFLFFPLIFLYIFFQIREKKVKQILQVFLYLGMGLMISSFFWLPAIFEKNYIFLGKNPIADRSLHFASIEELFIKSPIQSVKPPLLIGLIHLLGLIVSIIAFIISRNQKNRKIYIFSFISLFTALIMLFPFSSILWQLPLLTIIDFPWRVLIIIAFLLSFIAGSIVNLPKGKMIAFIAIILSIIFYFKDISPGARIYKNDQYYETNDATTTSNDELMPIIVAEKAKNRPDSKVLAVNGKVKDLIYNSNMISFKILMNNSDSIVINTLYFPGWEFLVDDIKQNILIQKNTGLITLNIASGSHLIKGEFSRTNIRKIADSLSLIGIILLLVLLIKNIKINRAI